MRLAKVIGWCGVLLLAGGPAMGAGGEGLAEVETTLEKWVETRELVSRTRVQWSTDREMLEQTVKLLERELSAVQAQAAGLGTNSAQVEKERGQAEAQLKASGESLDRTRRVAGELEGRIRGLLPRLPAPLQDLLKPLVARMPADPDNTRMSPGERMQVAVAVLNELDKFNNGIAVFSEKRRGEGNEDIAVETVYLGLGAAYFVNELGDFAGTGRPGAEGWDWSVDRSLAAAVQEVIRIYRNERAARFVPLPAVIR